MTTPRAYTEREIELGNRAVIFWQRIMLVAVIVMLVVAVIVVILVPWGTTVEYSRVSRSAELPVILMGLCPLSLATLYLSNRRISRKSSNGMPTWQRKYLLSSVMIIIIGALTVGQVVLAHAFLRAGDLLQ